MRWFMAKYMKLKYSPKSHHESKYILKYRNIQKREFCTFLTTIFFQYKGVSTKKKLQFFLSCLIISSILCLFVFIRRRKHVKLTDYHFLKDDGRFFWDKKFVDTSQQEEKRIEEIRYGKYVPSRLVVHIGRTKKC